ncbi:MAG: hypothetical protein A3F11_01720 [Gammaproteobacteria bacterium RIFCSPHIGHO2_12_FULL_37_14]|nr:MAG: hypothetical protein A3F11_01720 [Gammaproteobacteria bacterium RIFCSPHIGHO2_12_FULL_37_14]
MMSNIADSKTYQEIILFDEFYISSLIKDIENANKTIDIEIYIFADDVIGQQVINALRNAAHRGVKIRILIDGIGSFPWSKKITTQLETAGIITRIFHPLPWLIWQWWHIRNPTSSVISNILQLFSDMNSRNHCKISIIDQHIVYVGGANITIHNLNKADGGDHWRDTTVKLIGVNTEEIQFAFERIWSHLPIHTRLKYAFRYIDPEPIFRLNYSWRRRRILYRSLLKRMMYCNQRIWITNSYFVPDDFLLKTLIKAAKKGVDVRILLPYKSDVFIVSLASYTFYSTLLKGNIAIFEYLPSMLHAKTLILDDWYCVGSSNLNSRSLRHDLEVDVWIRTENAKIELEQQFIIDLEQSRKITKDDLKKQPFYMALAGRLFLFLRYWI